jgi:hypothetical protein
MGSVLISYNRGSLETVKALAEDVDAAGHESWFDQELTGGQRWWDSILARIRDCDILVFALTPESLESQACGREVDYALLLGKPVLPVLLSHEVNSAHLPPAIAQIQHLDYRKQDKQAAFKLVAALAGLPAAPPLPDPLPNPPAVPISYVVSLKEKIDNPAKLDYQDQIPLVLELRDRFRDGRPADEITQLLNRLKRRDDLLAKVAREIDTVLAEVAHGSRPTPQQPEPGTMEEGAPALERRALDLVTGTVGQDERHLQIDNAVDECAGFMRRVVECGEIWTFEIDPQNAFTLALDATQSESWITAKGSLRDSLSVTRSKVLKSLGWKINEHGFVKGAGAAAALYATSGVAALALLSKTVRDFLMSFEATRSWPVPRGRATLTGPAAEFALALQRVAPEVKSIIVRPETAS